MNKYTLGCGYCQRQGYANGSAQPPRVERIDVASLRRQTLRERNEKTRLMGIFFIGNHLSVNKQTRLLQRSRVCVF
jgi:hypothetical protein